MLVQIASITPAPTRVPSGANGERITLQFSTFTFTWKKKKHSTAIQEDTFTSAAFRKPNTTYSVTLSLHQKWQAEVPCAWAARIFLILSCHEEPVCRAMICKEFTNQNFLFLSETFYARETINWKDKSLDKVVVPSACEQQFKITEHNRKLTAIYACILQRMDQYLWQS